ncbi:hypothetical protein [Streptosporangium saharense]|uniref:hypothetical protein n=1 Tax=Streptosporangium saharense TaxID=1706840 RepID=UPI003333DDD0
MLTYAPDLNPVAATWSSLRAALLDFAVHGIEELTALVKHRLKCMQYQPELLTGFIAKTVLTAGVVAVLGRPRG